MRKILLMMILLVVCAIPVQASQVVPPVVPETGEYYMPENTESFAEGLWFVITSALEAVAPEIAQAGRIGITVIAIMIIVSVADTFPGVPKSAVHLCASLLIGLIVLRSSGSMIRLCMDSVTEMTQYAKLLIPVMGSALAAQGGVSSAAALHAGTAFFITVLTALATKLLEPMLYIYFCLCLINCAVGEELIRNLRNLIKWLTVWILKITIYCFSGYMGITGVISGTVDASALRAAKLTISGMVPVVGGIISEASETILVSASVMKNAAGVYGILAIIAVFIVPFLTIGIQYLMLKATTGICSVFGSKRESELLGDFTSGMGMILALSGTVCVLLLIGVVCFMKGLSG